MPKKRRVWAVRVDADTPQILDDMARQLGCVRVNGSGSLVGATGVLLDNIAKGKLYVALAD